MRDQSKPSLGRLGLAAAAVACVCALGLVVVFGTRAQSVPPPQPPPGPSTGEPRDVVYEQGPAGDLDLLIWGAGASGAPRPIVVLFHGGGFARGNARGFSHMCEDIIRASIACASVNYTLNGGERQAQEAKDAVAWVRRHAGELNIDPSHVFVGGGSAGGYLALSTAVLNPQRESTPDGLVLFNPVLVWTSGGGPAEDLGQRDQRALPPTVVFHGTADQISPYPNIQAFVAAAKSKGLKVDLETFAGRPHGFFNRAGSPDYISVTRGVVDFIKTGVVTAPAE